MAQNGLLFTPDSSSGGGATDFIKDAFVDYTFPPSNNSGLTDTALTNPTGQKFANTDQAQFGSKVILFKDMQLIQDRAKWISNKPTYSLNFTSGDFPSVFVYGFGALSKMSYSTDQVQIAGQAAGDGMGVTGKIRRLSWLISPADGFTSSTGQLKTDGVNTTTIDLTGNTTNINLFDIQWASFNHQASNETNDLHDFQLIDIKGGVLRVIGCIVYFENTGANVQVTPGTSYINKVKYASVAGATIAVGAPGSSFGGIAVIAKSALGYSQFITGQTCITSTAQGASGTNLVTVTTGQGGSFLAGHGIAVAAGTSSFISQVNSVSTDTLTLGTTLTFGFSNTPVYSMWRIGATLAVSATTMKLKTTFDFNNVSAVAQGTSLRASYVDLDNNYTLFNANMGVSTVTTGSRSAFFKGASGALIVQGEFQAAEVEMTVAGGSTLNLTIATDGLPGYTLAEGSTGSFKRTIFTDGAPGYHSVVITPGASTGVFMFNRINLFESNVLQSGITFGQIAQYPIYQSFIDRGAVNQTLMMIGTKRRLFPDQLYLKGAWTRGVTASSVGGAFYYGTSTNAVLSQTFFGRYYSLIGTAGGGTLAIDGVGIPLATVFNKAVDTGTEGFHTLTYTSGTGATSIIQAFDWGSNRGDISNLANFDFKTTFPVKPVAGKAYARYHQNSGQTIQDSTQTEVTFNIRHYDSDDMVQVSQGGANFNVIAPRDGLYEIISQVTYSSTTTWAEDETATTAIKINGRTASTISIFGQSGVAATKAVKTGEIFKLKRGDILTLTSQQTSGGALSLSTSEAENFFIIREI